MPPLSTTTKSSVIEVFVDISIWELLTKSTPSIEALFVILVREAPVEKSV